MSLDAEGDRPRPHDFFERDDDERDDAAKPSESVERGPMGGDAVSTGGRPPRAPGARGVASSGGPKRVPKKNADPGEALSRRETEEEDRPDARRPSRAERATSASRSEDPRTAAFGTAPSATRGSSAADESVETETRGDDDADPEAADVAEEVDALVSAACARGIGAAAQTLREAMAMASGKNAPGAACCDRHAARAMAEALAAALVKQILPGLAEASRARLLDAETRVRPASLASLDAEEDGIDLSAPEAIANPRAALLAAQLLDAMPPDDEDEDEDDEACDGSIETRRRRGPRERVLLALRLAFRARLGNCLEASRAGAFPPLARFLLSAARDAETNQTRRTKLVARLAQTCVARVSAQTVEPAHLRSYLAMARGASGAARGALVAALAEALEHTESLGPAATFQLDGEGSGLLGAAGGGDGSVGSGARTKNPKPNGANGASDVASDAATRGASFFRRLATAVAGGNALPDPDPRPRASLTRAAFGATAGVSGRRSEWPFKRGFAVVTWAYVESFRASRAAEDAAAATAAMASICAVSSHGGDAHRASPAAAAAAAAAAVGGDAQEHMPRLFSFLSTEASDKNGFFGAQGVEAYFHGSYLVVEATGADGARCAMPFTTPITKKKWICVAVEYDPPADEKRHVFRDDATRDETSKTSPHGEVRLYLDGAVVESHRFRVPRVSGPLGFCCVGTNPPAAMAGMQRRRRQCALFASLGPVYVFREAVGARAMAELARRGGTYAPVYTQCDGSPEATRELPVARSPRRASDVTDADHARLDASLATKLLQVLHPATAVAGAVPDLSPLGAGGTRSDRRGSLLGSGSSVVARMPIRDALERASPLGAAALLSLMCAEKETKDDAGTLAAALEPTLRAVAACLAGDASTRASAVAALEAASFASLLRRALPRALRALRDVRLKTFVSHHAEYSETETGTETVDERLDAEEARAVEAVEVLVAERAPSGSALRRSLCASFFASLDAWTGGADAEVRNREDASKEGVGVPALLRVLRVTHAMAHAEGGAALRDAGGATRLLEAARTRVRFPVCVFFPAGNPGPAGAPGGGPGGQPGGAFPASGRATVPPSLRAGVEGAPPGPPRLENASFGVRAPFFLTKKDAEKATAASPPSAAKKSSLADARGALLDALVPPVSALLRSDANAQEALSAVVAFAGDCEDPRVAARALAAVLEFAESPGATGAAARRAFVRAGGADACAGMLRALALRYEGNHDVVAERNEQQNDARLGAGELAATCARVLLALARGGELASSIRLRGESTSFATRGTSFLDAALAERATRHAFRLAPQTLLTVETWSACLSAPEDGVLGAALEALSRASATTRRRALADARALCLSEDVFSPGACSGARLASLPEWPTWLVACVVRESADAADASADATRRAAARAAAKVGLEALNAALRRACHKAGGWRRVESAARAFREHFHFDTIESGDARSARAARRALERALGAHAAFAASSLRAARPDPDDGMHSRSVGVKTWTSAADAEAARRRTRRESCSRVSSLGSDAEFSFTNAVFERTDGATNAVAASEAEATETRATLLAHARATLLVIDETLEEPSFSERTSSSTEASSSEQEEEEEEEEEDAHDARLCLLRSARELVDALLASSESSATTPLPRAVAAAALRVATRSLRAATENPTKTKTNASSSDSDSDASSTETSRGNVTSAPLVSAACAEAAAAADGLGAGGVSAADALGYAFAKKTSDKKDAEASEHSRCLATTHRVLAPYLQGGRSRFRERGASAPHFAVAALFSELKRNEEEAASAKEKNKKKRAEETSAFLCAHLLCLLGRWRSAVAEACADDEKDAHDTSASASAASELLGTAEPTRAMLLRPAAEAVAATLAPPWSDALAPSTRVSAAEKLRSDAVLETERSDGDDAHATAASRAARANAERAAADARERAFEAFDAIWRRLGAPAKERGEGDEEASARRTEGDPADPLSPFANLSAKMAHVASRWRELLERASSARDDARNEALESARRDDEAWRAFAAHCAEAGLGDVAW